MRKWKATVIRSDRRTLSLQIKPDGSLLVRAPLRLPKKEIDRVLQEKSAWIEKHLAQVENANRAAEEEPLSMEDIRALADKALQVIPPRVGEFARRMGVSYGRITIRNQTGRWGSCSGEGNLNFNCLLMLAPLEVVDYVIVHELAHRKQMNHSPAFWQEVARELPEYSACRGWLKQNGGGLLARLRQDERSEP